MRTEHNIIISVQVFFKRFVTYFAPSCVLIRVLCNTHEYDVHSVYASQWDRNNGCQKEYLISTAYRSAIIE